jgi:hypothetical protein
MLTAGNFKTADLSLIYFPIIQIFRGLKRFNSCGRYPCWQHNLLNCFLSCHRCLLCVQHLLENRNSIDKESIQNPTKPFLATSPEWLCRIDDVGGLVQMAPPQRGYLPIMNGQLRLELAKLIRPFDVAAAADSRSFLGLELLPLWHGPFHCQSGLSRSLDLMQKL